MTSTPRVAARAVDHGAGALSLQLGSCSPAQRRRLAADLVVRHGRVDSPFGPALLGFSDEGICLLHFPRPAAQDAAIIAHYLPGARYRPDAVGARQQAIGLFELSPSRPIVAWAWGSPFQVEVWRELASLPPGAVLSYAELATRVGRPRAARAVGTAMARNPLAWLVPCHRVVRSDGNPGLYQGGNERKVAMLAWERERVGDSVRLQTRPSDQLLSGQDPQGDGEEGDQRLQGHDVRHQGGIAAELPRQDEGSGGRGQCREQQ